jgi:hypothetical protein
LPYRKHAAVRRYLEKKKKRRKKRLLREFCGGEIYIPFHNEGPS